MLDPVATSPNSLLLASMLLIRLSTSSSSLWVFFSVFRDSSYYSLFTISLILGITISSLGFLCFAVSAFWMTFCWLWSFYPSPGSSLTKRRSCITFASATIRIPPCNVGFIGFILFLVNLTSYWAILDSLLWTIISGL